MASYNSKFITGDKLKPIIQDVYAEINKTSTNASTEITNALNTAKTYAENKSTEALNSAKNYADNVGSTTLSSAKSYADNVGSSTLTAAKKYTDDEVSAALDTSTEYTNDEVAKSLASAKEYADGIGTSTLNSAKAYTDNVGSTTLSSAKSYTDNVGSNTLSSANSYTDTSIENLVDNAPTDANTLKKLNDRINTNVQSISDLSNVVDTKATDADLTAHKNDKSNPHSVTKAQVGLGNADNTADKDKNVLSATKLTTARTIFGNTFDGTASIKGQATVYGTYQSDTTKRYLRSAIQICENGLVGSTQSDIGYGPAIGFHWNGHAGGTLAMGSSGTFYLKTEKWSRATLDANIVGNLTGNITGDVTGNITGDIKGNVTGNLTGTATNATNDSLGQKIDTTYIKGLSVSGRVITYTRGDDTIGTITTQDTTYPVFTGATSSTAGTTGLVPAPGSGDNLKFLRADGKWVVPTDTNTWRPIEDVLTSTSTVNSLTANQGRVLKELIESKATEAKNYTDSVGSSTLSSAKTYADGVGSDTLNSAKSYADGVGTTTLNSAKEYSDSNVKTLLGGASTDSNTLKKLEDKISSLTNSSATDADLTAHKNDKSNPHSVTKAQVGLGNADNTADADKNVLSATKLTTARSIFGQTFNGTADVAGKGRFYGTYTSTASNRYSLGGLQIRENSLVANTQSDIGYAPSIGFHWSNTAAGTLLLNSDGYFYLKTIDGTTRATLDADIIGNVSGNSSTATKLATARNIQVNLASTSATSFDGSANIIPGVTGVLGVANGGTGKTTGEDAANYFLNSLSTGSNNPTLSDYYIAQYSGGGTTTTTYHRRPLSALWNTFNAEAAKVYLPLSGGTMTGNISFKGTSGTTHTMITFKSGADANGDGIVIGGGGLTVIGSGESAATVAAQFNGSSEHMCIASDGLIYFYSNTNNGWDSRKIATFDTTGVFTAPSFSGSLSGNASSASKLETSRTIALTGSVTGSGTFDGSGDLTINTTTNHTHNYAGSSSVGGAATTALACTGNSATASKWKDARTLTLTGAVTGSVSIDGSGNVSMTTSEGDVSFKRMSTSINPSTDWNAITTPGAYTVSIAAWGDASTLNSPNSNISNLYSYGLLLVFESGLSGYHAVTQIYIPHYSGSGNNDPVTSIMVRQKYQDDSGWVQWRTIYNGITKSYIGLGNVENKSSATIRSEITKTNVTTALGYTPSASGHTHNYIVGYSQGTRLTSANLATNTNGMGAIFGFVATTSMTEGKPPTDAQILHMNWDTEAGYASQLAISNNGTDRRAWIRGQSMGTWGDWRELVTVTKSTAIGSTTQPVYINATGQATACTYTLGKSVPSNALFTDANVLQEETTTASYRPVLMGYYYNDDPSKLGTSTTNRVQLSTKFYAQPSTGTIFATKFNGTLVGNADSATKLTSSAGSTTNPVYFSDGKPVACTYSLNKTVPADAKFTDTNTHYTTHLYAGTSSGVANAATTNGNTYLILTDDSTARNRIKIAGSGATSVASDANGAITISSTNTTYSAATSSAAGLMSAEDKKKLDTFGGIVTRTKTLTITTEWQDTGISGEDLASGSYIIQVSGMSWSATDTWYEIWTGFMSWYSGDTNSADTDEIVLHKAGHASNNSTIYLRTIRQKNMGSNVYLKLQICASTDFSETSVTFKFRKLI